MSVPHLEPSKLNKRRWQLLEEVWGVYLKLKYPDYYFFDGNPTDGCSWIKSFGIKLCGKYREIVFRFYD